MWSWLAANLWLKGWAQDADARSIDFRFVVNCSQPAGTVVTIDALVMTWLQVEFEKSKS